MDTKRWLKIRKEPFAYSMPGSERCQQVSAPLWEQPHEARSKTLTIQREQEAERQRQDRKKRKKEQEEKNPSPQRGPGGKRAGAVPI